MVSLIYFILVIDVRILTFDSIDNKFELTTVNYHLIIIFDISLFFYDK